MKNSENSGVPLWLAKLGVKPSEWLVAMKTDFRSMMRPGRDLNIRVSACLLEFSRGYRGEFAMMQVGKHEDGTPKFAPVTPAAINNKLLKVAREEFRQSGKPLTEDEDKLMHIGGPHMRHTLEQLEVEDGLITAVTATKMLAYDEATLKLARADMQILMGGLPYKDALARGLIVPIRELPMKDRQRLAGKSFIYVHIRPRPASISALTRHTTDDGFPTAQPVNGLEVVTGVGAQTFFRFCREKGVPDPARLAAELAERPDGRALVTQLAEAKEAIRRAEASIRDLVARAAANDLPPAAPIAKQDELPLYGPVALVPGKQASTALNSNGSHEERGSTRQTPTTAARAVDPETEMPAPPKKPKTAEELAPVTAAMLTVGVTETLAVKQLFGYCRDEAPDCTPEEVADAVYRRIAIQKGKPTRNWVGYLHKTVPQLFESPGFEKWREEQREFDRQEQGPAKESWLERRARELGEAKAASG